MYALLPGWGAGMAILDFRVAAFLPAQKLKHIGPKDNGTRLITSLFA